LSFTIEVRNNNVEKALRVMKKKMKKEGLFQELKDRQYYQKPSFKRRETKKRRYINIKKSEKIRRNFL
jgi:small subunit ribosomal protein S21